MTAVAFFLAETRQPLCCVDILNIFHLPRVRHLTMMCSPEIVSPGFRPVISRPVFSGVRRLSDPAFSLQFFDQAKNKIVVEVQGFSDI